MAGVVLAVGTVATTTLLSIGLAAVGSASVVAQRASGAADAAALAAADALSGAADGVPCDRAIQLASAAGAAIVSCELEGPIATVVVDLAIGVLHARAEARAGPPR